MGALHIKIINGNGQRLLEMTQYHNMNKKEIIDFLDKIENLFKKLAKEKK